MLEAKYLLLLLTAVNAYHFVFAGGDDRGHWQIPLAVAQEAIAQGHQATFVAPESAHSFFKNLKGVTILKAGKGQSKEQRRKHDEETTKASLWKIVTELVPERYREGTVVAQVVAENGEQMKFDLCLIDLFSIATVAACEKLGIPSVLTLGTDVTILGINHIAAWYMTYSFILERKMTNVIDRLLNMMATFILTNVNFYNAQQLLIELRTAYGLPHRPVSAIADGYVWITNAFPPFSPAGPRAMNVIDAGPMIPQTSSQPLTEYYRSYLEQESTKPVFYVSMGSITILSKEEIIFFLQAFRSEMFRVLWSLRQEQQELISKDQLPPNVQFEKWVPQNAIIQHPSVFAVFTHGGQGGVLECISAGKPMIFRPGFAPDQGANAYSAEKNDVGFVYSKESPESLQVQILTLLDEKDAYQQRVRKLAAIGQRFGGTKKTIEVFKNLIEVGDSMYVPDYADEGFSKRFFLDVLTIIVVITVILTSILMTCVSYLCCWSKPSKIKTE